MIILFGPMALFIISIVLLVVGIAAKIKGLTISGAIIFGVIIVFGVFFYVWTLGNEQNEYEERVLNVVAE